MKRKESARPSLAKVLIKMHMIGMWYEDFNSGIHDYRGASFITTGARPSMWPYFHLMRGTLSLPGGGDRPAEPSWINTTRNLPPKPRNSLASTREPESDALFHTDVALITRQTREHGGFR